MVDTIFQGDPRLKLTVNGSSIEFIGGQPVMDQGLENLALISLFTKSNWPGNDLFEVTREKYGSDFEEALNQAITVDSLNNIRKAAEAALDSDIFGTVTVVVENPYSYWLKITITIEPPGQDIGVLTLERNGVNWISQAVNPAYRRL